MGKLAEAYVDIRGDDSNLTAALGRSKSSLGSFVAGAGRTLGGLAIGAGISTVAAELFQAARKAADLHESLDKVKNAFGSSGSGIVRQADDLATKFGVVKQESLDAASAFGLMGRAAGLSKEQSAGLGSEFVRLGIDLASFHNLTNAEAFEKLRSGLAGESEPLRPLGILLSDDAVKAEALAMGLVKVKRELTDQEKVLARVSLIRKQMENQGSIGDRERTSDSASNQMKQLAGDWENFKTQMGETVLPALVDAMKLAKELGQDFEKTFGTGPIEAFGGALKTTLATIRLLNEQNNQQVMIRDKSGKVVKATQESVRANSSWGGLVLPKVEEGKSLQDIADKQQDVAKGIPKPESPAARLQRQQDTFLKGRAAQDAQFAQAQKDAKDFAAKQFRDSLKGAAKGLFENFGKTLGAIPGALSGDRLTALGAQGRLQAAGGAGGLLLRGGLEAARRIADTGYNSDRKMSQSFEGGSDLNRAIQAQVMDQSDVQKKQLDKLEEAGKKLGEIKEGIGEVAKNLKDKFAARFSGR